MDEAALHKWVERQLPAFGKLSSQLKKVVWEECNEEGFIEAALDSDLEAGKDELLKKVERIIKRIQLARERPSPPGRSRSKEHRPFLMEWEQARADALSVMVAKQAADTALVRRFRAEILHDRILSQQQALAWLKSPATRLLSTEMFADYAIPMVDHEAFEVSPPGKDWFTPSIYSRNEEVTLRITWAGGMFEERLESPLFPRTFLYVPTEDGRGIQRIMAWPDSVLGSVATISKELAKLYFWHEDAAMMFLLTDAPPFIAPLQVYTQGHSRTVNDRFPEEGDDPKVFKNARWPIDLYRVRITLIADIWVSDATLLRALKAARRQVLKRDNRPLDISTSALVGFVAL